MPTLATIIQHSFGSPRCGDQRRQKIIKGIWIGKEEIKPSLFTDDMILYIENPKDATRKLLKLINEYSQVTGHKINTQKFLASLYTNNEKSEREIKETASFTIATKRIKYLRIKETEDLYAANYKTLMKEIKVNTNRWREARFLDWKNQYWEMTVPPKAVYRVSAVDQGCCSQTRS